MLQDIFYRKYSIPEILIEGSLISWAQSKNILLIFLLLYLPFCLIGSFIRANLTFGVIFGFISICFNILGSVALARLIGASVNEQNIAWKQAIRDGVSRWLPAIGTLLVAVLIITVGFIFCIIPGLVMSVYYIFVLYVIALRSESGISALIYSFDLVKGQWWRVFGYLLLLGLIESAMYAVVGVANLFFPKIWLINFLSSAFADLVTIIPQVITVVFFLNLDYLKSREKPIVTA